MRTLRLFSMTLLLIVSASARAQAIDAYGTFSLMRAGTGTQTLSEVSGITDIYTPATNPYVGYGFTLGSTYNFVDSHTQQLGIDLRGTFAPSSKNGGFLVMSGLRYSAFPRHSHFRPYVGMDGGALVQRAAYTDTSIVVSGPLKVTNVDTSAPATLHAAFAGLVGLDARIYHHLSYRAEFGAGHVGHSANSTGPTGGTLILFNTGLVFHFDY